MNFGWLVVNHYYYSLIILTICSNLHKGWETTQEEHHPNPHGNGIMTADYFKNDFGLTGREGAALLIGAHSFGSFNDKISQFRYDWTRKQGSMLNNQLFRLKHLSYSFSVVGKFCL